tara:strand:- start:213 stop:932 length:720 start_codon:yes stop_codon:yes gene_type:complete
MFKKAILALTAMMTLASCTTGQMKAEYGELRVNSKMSQTIFLEPVAPKDQIIYVKVRSTAGNKTFRLQSAIVEEMRAIGYTITNDPTKANFVLQANIRNYQSQVQAADGAGESIVGAVLGGVLGSAIGGGKGQEIATTLGAVAGGAAAQKYANSTVLVEYVAEVDLEISQKALNDINYRTSQNVRSGEGSTTSANFSRQSQWEKYRTKLYVSAKKINLTEAEATPQVVNEITASISNLF